MFGIDYQEIIDSLVENFLEQDHSDRHFGILLREGCVGFDNEDPKDVIEDYFFAFNPETPFTVIRPEARLEYRVESEDGITVLITEKLIEEPFSS